MTDATGQESREAQPPSVTAARLSDLGERSPGRAYPINTAASDPAALGAELAATQALLRAECAAEVEAVVSTLVHDLGGALVVARYADPATAIPVDVSLGLSEPLLPVADPVSVATMRLRAILPQFLEEARIVMTRMQAELRRDEEARRDHLTGVLTRRAWMRRLSKAAPGDSVCFIDLDHFKALNDTSGHSAGDVALNAFGALMLRIFREVDICGRYGGDEFVGLSPGVTAEALMTTCDGIRQAWNLERPPEASQIGLTIGVAEVGVEGGRAALKMADAAMYRAKARGRNQTVMASRSDNEPGHR